MEQGMPAANPKLDPVSQLRNEVESSQRSMDDEDPCKHFGPEGKDCELRAPHSSPVAGAAWRSGQPPALSDISTAWLSLGVGLGKRGREAPNPADSMTVQGPRVKRNAAAGILGWGAAPGGGSGCDSAEEEMEDEDEEEVESRVHARFAAAIPPSSFADGAAADAEPAVMEEERAELDSGAELDSSSDRDFDFVGDFVPHAAHHSTFDHEE